MKLKLILGVVCLSSVCAFADYFVWPAQKSNENVASQKSAKTQNPNLGYYVDARTNKVVGLINVEKGSRSNVDMNAPRDLKIGSKNNQVKLKGAETEEYQVNEEVIKLW